MRLCRLCVFLVLVPLASESALAESWTGFRGPAGDGVSSETGLPVKWSADSGLAWSTPLKGVGNSSPAVVQDRVYVTSTIKEDRSLWVTALDRASGKVAWEKQIGQGSLVAYGPPSQFEFRHDPATPSPCADEEGRVFAFFGTGNLVCLDREGTEVWRLDLAEKYGPYDLKWGMAASPRLWGDTLYVACVHKGPSYVLALDKNTGKEKWLTPRNYPGLGDAQDSYGSPAILRGSGKTPAQLIVVGSDHADAYDLENGQRLWFNRGLLIESEYARTVISPAVGEGIVVANSAKNEICIAIRADGTGDITDSQHEIWKGKGMADCPTPTVHNGLIYAIKDEGVGSCIDLNTGKELWKKRMAKERAQASPVVGDGRVYFLSLDGQCTVVKEGRTFQLVSENVLPEGNYYATPAISSGMIFLRERTRLYAVGGSSAARN